MQPQNLTLTDVYQTFLANGKMNAVAAAGARVAQATVGFLDSSPTMFAAAILAAYGMQRPVLYSKGVVSDGTNCNQSLAETTAKWQTEVFGVVVDINASQTLALGSLTFGLSVKSPWGDTLDNSITIEPAQPDTLSGSKSVRIFVFGGLNINGIYHFMPMSLRPALEATNLPAHTIAFSTNNWAPSGAAISIQALTRGNPHVDDLVRELLK